MPRDIKKRGGLETDFSITDAVKRAVRRRRSQERLAGDLGNEHDDLSDELDRAGESDYIRSIFDN